MSTLRLSLGNGLTLAAGCLLAYLAMAQLHGLATRLSLDAELQDSARSFAEFVWLDQNSGPDAAPFPAPDSDVFGVRPVFIQAIATDGTVLARSANLGNRELPVASQSVTRALGGEEWFDTLTLDGHFLRSYLTPLHANRGPGEAPFTGLVEAVSPVEDDPHARLPLTWLAISASSGVLAAVVVGWLLAQTAIAPVEELARTVRAINSARDLTVRVPMESFRRHDILRRLAEDVNGMLARLQAAARDVEVALEAQRRFVADASHELRTPLTSLRGNVQLLAQLFAEHFVRAPRAEHREILADMTHEAERMTRLLDGLLVLARADARQHLILAPTELEPVLRQSYRAGRALAEDVQLQLDDLVPDVWLRADPDRLQQVVLILVENALKYTPPGGTVRLRSRLQIRDGRPGVTIDVCDSGPGILLFERERIFDRFYRSETVRRHSGGAGLGLSVARWIATEHGGEISVRDAEPNGSIFSFWLPRIDPRMSHC